MLNTDLKGLVLSSALSWVKASPLQSKNIKNLIIFDIQTVLYVMFYCWRPFLEVEWGLGGPGWVCEAVFVGGMNFICTFLSKGFPFDNNKIMNLTIFNIQIVLYVFFLLPEAVSWRWNEVHRVQLEFVRLFCRQNEVLRVQVEFVWPFNAFIYSGLTSLCSCFW